MFLVTTAIEEYWKTDKPLLFLGEWCKLYSKKHIWSELNYKVLPYHWDNREKFYNDNIYINSLYEKYLKVLHKQLNIIHNLEYSEKYWRRIIGRWLYSFIGGVYDRYCMLQMAGQQKGLTDTYISFSKYPLAQMYPNQINSLLGYDSFNHLLCSYIIKYIKNIPYTEIVNNDFSFNLKKKNDFSYKNLLKQKCFKLTPNKFKNIVFISPYIDPKNIQIALHQLPLSFECEDSPLPEVDISEIKRNRLLEPFQAADEFESLLNRLLKVFTPTIFIEGYKQFSDASLRIFPKSPKVILFGTSQDSFNFYSAYYREKGTKTVEIQHGGHYGAGLLNVEEEESIKINDRFFSQGWDSSESKTIIPLPAIQHYKKRENFKYNQEGDILWGMMSVPRYYYLSYSLPVGPQFQNYIDQQFQLADLLSDEVFKKILIRFYTHDYGWDEKRRWIEYRKKIRIDTKYNRLTDALQKSRLFICTYNATTILESLYMNIPTVAFWNPEHWELRESAKSYYGLLLDSGILHYSPKSAANKINAVFDNPQEWWGGRDIQEARTIFCQRFARQDSNWVSKWKKEITSLL